MFSKWIVWMILARLTGSPIGSAVALLLVYWVIDRYTLGFLPDPFRWVWRLQREGALSRTLAQNPHDSRARLEWANLLLERGKHARAIEVLKPAVARGEEDAGTLFTMGAACLGAGYHEQGEKLLGHVDELSPDFRVAETDLVRGRARLSKQDFPGAKASLERLVSVRKGTVEGRVLLSRAMAALGDDGGAALMRDQAWHEYAMAPGFQRRRDRLWAWRARPSRPLMYGAAVVVTVFLLAQVVGPVVRSQQLPADEDESMQGP